MKNEAKGVFIFEDPEEFLKVISKLQEIYNNSSIENGADESE